MYVLRGEVPQALMRSLRVVMIDISADLIPGGYLVGIAADNMDPLLLDRSEEPFRQGIVGGPSHPGIGEIGAHKGKELLRYPGRVR